MEGYSITRVPVKKAVELIKKIRPETNIPDNVTEENGFYAEVSPTLSVPIRVSIQNSEGLGILCCFSLEEIDKIDPLNILVEKYDYTCKCVDGDISWNPELLI